MNKLLMTTALVLISSAAYAQTIVINGGPQREPEAQYGSESLENVRVKQNPFDIGRLNESPIRGKGAIKVVHNEPVPGDPDRALHDARWLLQDNGYTCYAPKVSRR